MSTKRTKIQIDSSIKAQAENITMAFGDLISDVWAFSNLMDGRDNRLESLQLLELRFLEAAHGLGNLIIKEKEDVRKELAAFAQTSSAIEKEKEVI